MRKKIDVNKMAKERGYRNFCSCVFLYYYSKKETPKQVSKRLGISVSKFISAMNERSWPIRGRQAASLYKKRVKKKILIFDRLRKKAYPRFPWCHLYILYHKYFLTIYQVGDACGMSAQSVLKMMRRYKIERRNQGTSIIGSSRDFEFDQESTSYKLHR